LVGAVEETKMLPFKFTPAVLTEDVLKTQSKLRREKLVGDA
jgi:hypothetical protein